MTNLNPTQTRNTMWGGRDIDSKLLKVVVLGDSGVGKTSMIKRFVNNAFSSIHVPSLGVHFMNKDVTVGDERYTLQVWDTSGQERYKSMQAPFYRGADCLLLIFSVDDWMSFQNLIKWLEEFFKYQDTSVPFVLVGNKVDLENRAVTRDHAREWCCLYGDVPYFKNGVFPVPYFETSAKDAVNVESAFLGVVNRFRQMEHAIEPRLSDASTVELEPTTRVKKSCC